MRGEVVSSPRLVFAMIRNLPEGANFTAVQQAKLEAETRGEYEKQNISPDVQIELDPVQEFKQWTEDRRLMAQLINAVNLLVRHSVQWQKPPNIPLVGPSSWRGEGDSKSAKAMTVMDVINRITGTNG